MPYEPLDWANLPAKSSRINAARLSHMETQYQAVEDDVDNPETTLGAKLNSTIAAGVVDKQDASALDDDSAALVGTEGTALRIAIENLAGNYDSEALALFDRMDVRPDANRRAAINGLIVALKSAGVWTKLDSLHVFAAHTPQAALVNWRAATDATSENSPTFTPSAGFKGDGATSRIVTNMPSNTLLQHQANSASFGVWVYEGDSASSTGADISNGNAFFNAKNSSGDLAFRAYTGTTRSADTDSALGLSLISRDATHEYAYKDGALVGTVAVAPTTTRPAAAFSILNRNSGALTRGLSAAVVGAFLDGTESAYLYNALNDYMTAIAA